MRVYPAAPSTATGVVAEESAVNFNRHVSWADLEALTRRVKRLEEVLDAFSQYAYDQGDPQPMPVDMMREILQRQTK
jgi:hypothetical protein